jgi:hypothetical protein
MTVASSRTAPVAVMSESMEKLYQFWLLSTSAFRSEGFKNRFGMKSQKEKLRSGEKPQFFFKKPIRRN